MDKTRPLYVYFCPFHNAMTNIVQNFTLKAYLDSVLGILTWDHRMLGADESTEYGGL